MDSEKYMAVKFLQDGVYYVCKYKKANFKRKCNSLLVRWLDRKFYEAEIVAEGRKADLESVVHNVSLGLPKVLVSPMKTTGEWFFFYHLMNIVCSFLVCQKFKKQIFHVSLSSCNI